jgi:hypothetical protein
LGRHLDDDVIDDRDGDDLRSLRLGDESRNTPSDPNQEGNLRFRIYLKASSRRRWHDLDDRKKDTSRAQRDDDSPRSRAIWPVAKTQWL